MKYPESQPRKGLGILSLKGSRWPGVVRDQGLGSGLGCAWGRGFVWFGA